MRARNVLVRGAVMGWALIAGACSVPPEEPDEPEEALWLSLIHI